ncbi:hypothetical protein QBC40DRAFT_94211 [Triangularia verruculosa]|uniref:Uncharacterized protein n=1 Tax=Triangularia verruculosa TaxID=2587418 RepID=A0AAN6XD75_9PEZI|nr:hypothetical protein QBC40DRAFT_94211 [Triangularia verruculosa]
MTVLTNNLLRRTGPGLLSAPLTRLHFLLVLLSAPRFSLRNLCKVWVRKSVNGVELTAVAGVIISKCALAALSIIVCLKTPTWCRSMKIAFRHDFHSIIETGFGTGLDSVPVAPVTPHLPSAPCCTSTVQISPFFASCS